jgi:hypothetical protein
MLIRMKFNIFSFLPLKMQLKWALGVSCFQSAISMLLFTNKQNQRDDEMKMM